MAIIAEGIFHCFYFYVPFREKLLLPTMFAILLGNFLAKEVFLESHHIARYGSAISHNDSLFTDS
jgi:hypothetical protein